MDAQTSSLAETSSGEVLAQRLMGLLVGLVMVGIGVVLSWTGFASRSWPSTQGKILEMVIRSAPGKGATYRYWPEYHYLFEVDGKAYSGNALRAAGQPTMTEAKAYEIIRQHPKDSPVEVFYDPQNPSSCLLEPGIQVTFWIAFLLGGGTLLAGGCLASLVSPGQRTA